MNNKLFIGLTAISMMMLSISCTKADADDTIVTSPLDVPQVSVVEKQATSLTFSWSDVSGAISYYYKLYSSDGGLLLQSATKENSVTFNDLMPLTTYKITVKAQASSSEFDSAYSETVEGVTTSEEENENNGDDNGGNGDDYAGVFEFPVSEEDNLVRAFPGAEGAGMFTTGGRGGTVIYVTNLNDSGSGSLREAISKSGVRTIVFSVAGVIELNSTLKISNGNVTIAGQTAPGDGICLKNYPVVVDADNVIIRYMRFRPGDAIGEDGTDAIWGRYCENVILDHCSMSWSTDECSSFYTNRNFTMQWCLLTESLHNTVHSKGSHGYGGIWGGAPASFHHNLLANHDSRNPRFDSPNTYSEYNSSTDISLNERAIDFRNNVVYNFCNYPAYGGEGANINFVGNVYKWGPASINGVGSSYSSSGTETVATSGKMRKYFYSVDGSYTTDGVTYDVGAPSIYYGENSNVFDSSALSSDHADYNFGETLSANNDDGFPLNTSSLSSVKRDITWLSSPLAITQGDLICATTTHEGDDILDCVLAYVGASKSRDSVDERAVTGAKNGTYEQVETLKGSANGIIDSPDDVGGYPSYLATESEIAAILDTDSDGIPDSWEDEYGLDKSDASDGSKYTLDSSKRYTNLEVYMHWIVKDITNAQVEKGYYVNHN
ncbi:MAG: fibronectin type III domain-containing protein [Rikenellaceae bacterium]